MILEKDEQVSWFIHCGEYDSREDFYQPIHWYHLKEILSKIFPYLALHQGFNFIIDKDDYEDVWQSE